MSNLVLASASASRARLLTAAGVAFTIDPADIDEAALMAAEAGREAGGIAGLLAEQKALAVSRRHAGALVLGGDSVLAFDGAPIGKCADRAAARALLARLAGREHRILSAAALARDGKILWRHLGAATLVMRDFSPEFLEAYLEREGDALLSSVGCYHFEGRGAQLFDRVEGDYFSILGLPLLPLLTALRDQGVLNS